MADRKEIIVRIEGGASSGGGTSQAKSVSLTKQTTAELEKQLRTEQNLVQQRKILNELIKRETKNVGKASDKAKRLGQSWRDVNDKISRFNREVKKGSNTWGKALDSYQMKFNALGNIISNVTSYAIRAFVNGIKSVINISKEFEEQMSAVRAVSKATSEQFERLRSDAVRLGGSTIFTSKQVAELQLQLAKLGFTTGEIISATEGILALAAAAGEDLASSAAIAGGVLRAFGEDANNIKRIVDAMAKSFTSSALDLTKFRESMKFVAPVASKAGFSMEGVTALLGKLADQMVHGSLAGTSLRNIFLRLSNENSKLSKAMGLSAKSLPELIIGLENLERAGLDATMALQLTDRRAVTALLALAQQSDGIWELYRSIVETTGAADEMAEIRMDNFAGSVEKMTGAWDSFILAINKSNGLLRDFVDGARYAVEAVTELFKTQQDKAEDFASRYLDLVKKQVQEDISIKTKAVNDEFELMKLRYDSGEISLKRFVEFSRKKQEELTEIRSESLLKMLRLQYAATEDDERAAKQAWMNASKRDQKETTIRYNKIISARKKILDTISELETTANKQLLTNQLLAIEEELKNEMKIRKLMISSMRDGVEKELALNALKWDQLISNANELNVTINDVEKRRQEERLAILKKYQNEAYEERREANEKLTKDLMAIWKLRIEGISDTVQKELAQEDFRWRQQVNTFSKMKMETSLYLQATEEAWKQHWIRMFDIQARAASAQVQAGREGAMAQASVFDDLRKRLEASGGIGDDKFAPNLWDQITGGMELTSQQETAMRRGVDVVVDQLGYLADKQKEYADEAVQNSERKVDQLQRDLEIELRLAEAGFANNVSLRQKELADAKAAQAKALAQQREAQKKQERIEAVAQGVNLTTAISGILKKSFTTRDPITALIVSAGAAAGLMGLFSQWKNNIKADVQTFGEGGEITGKKHTQGGELIEAEDGEFVVKASQYEKYKDLVTAINEDKVNQAWAGLNQDLNVDNSDMIGAMNKYWGTQVTEHNGYRIERTGNRTRKVYVRV